MYIEKSQNSRVDSVGLTTLAVRRSLQPQKVRDSDKISGNLTNCTRSIPAFDVNAPMLLLFLLLMLFYVVAAAAVVSPGGFSAAKADGR